LNHAEPILMGNSLDMTIIMRSC